MSYRRDRAKALDWLAANESKNHADVHWWKPEVLTDRNPADNGLRLDLTTARAIFDDLERSGILIPAIVPGVGDAHILRPSPTGRKWLARLASSSIPGLILSILRIAFVLIRFAQAIGLIQAPILDPPPIKGPSDLGPSHPTSSATTPDGTPTPLPEPESRKTRAL